MPPQKIRAFLATDVLLEYIRGKAELQGLFSEEVRERAVLAINDVVVQELLLSSADLTSVASYLEIMPTALDMSSPETQASLHEVRKRKMHVNDVLILAGARSCDVLLTYDRDLLDVGKGAEVRSETPEEFLVELGAVA